MNQSTLKSNIIDVLTENAVLHPERKAHTFLDKQNENEQTYEQLLTRSKAIATSLQRRFKLHERIILIYEPGIEYINAFFGCLFAGLVAIPTYPPVNQSIAKKLQGIILDASPSAIMTTTAIASNLKKIKWVKRFSELPFGQKLLPKKIKSQVGVTAALDFDNLPIITTDNISSKESSNWQYPNIKKNDLAFLQYTSGSTGQPKGVMISHENLITNVDLIKNEVGLTENDINVIWLPPYHDMGLINGILIPVYCKFPVILFSPYSFIRNPYMWLSTVSRYRATVTGGPNFAFDLCVKRITQEQKTTLDLSSLAVLFSGAEPIRHGTIENFSNAFKECGFNKRAFWPCYGMAEATLLVCGTHYESDDKVLLADKEQLAKNKLKLENKASEDTKAIVTCGKNNNSFVKIINPDTLQECADDEIGEIFVNNGSIALGYWNNPVQTEYAFLNKITDDDRWFYRSGDLGFIHNKNVYVTGRRKDLININGLKYYPQDIEETIDRAHPLVKAGCSAAFMIEKDQREALAVVVEVKADDNNKDPTEVINAIIKSISKRNRLSPSTIALIKPKTLYKTTSGKIERYANKAALLEERLQIVAFWQKIKSKAA